MKKKTKGKKGVMALKLDMTKTYDKIEWYFVSGTMEAMGFPSCMVGLIRCYIETIFYKILINGQPSMEFMPERGLWQGDPISPYLFVLCADVLSGLLKRESREASIHEVKIARKSLIITHLFFANDSLLFTRANGREEDIVMNIL